MIRWSGAITRYQPVQFAIMMLVGLTTVIDAHSASPPLKPAKLQADTILYIMRPGDNLYMLGQRYFQKRGDYLHVAGINKISHARAIPTGATLNIPVSILRYEPLTARVVALRGKTSLHRPSTANPLAQGTVLHAGDAIETGIDGFVSIELPNGTRVSLPTRSALHIRALRRFLLTGSVDYDLEVSAGKAETQATRLPPQGGQVRIRTPRAVSAVRGTKFRVGYADGNSATEVLEGSVTAGASGGVAQPIEQGYGAAISTSGIIRQEKLLPPPKLIGAGKIQVEPEVKLSFMPIDGAKAYHVQIAADASFVDVFTEQTIESTEARFVNVPDGSWFARISAVAASGLEGQTETIMLRRVLAGVQSSGGGDADLLRFRWSGTGGNEMVYRFQMFRDKQDGMPIVDEPGLTAGGIVLSSPGPGTYYWRVGVRRFTQDGMVENWPSFEKLLVATPDSAP